MLVTDNTWLFNNINKREMILCYVALFMKTVTLSFSFTGHCISGFTSVFRSLESQNVSINSKTE